MRRMVVWAADHGFDRVAWTTGDQQAERYNLAQIVNDLSARRVEHGGMEDRFNIETSSQVAGAELERGGIRYAPHRLITPANDPPRRRNDAARISKPSLWPRVGATDCRASIRTASTETVIDTRDLRVGGDGMRAFYDRNLVNITNDIIKRYGEKVGPKAIEHPDLMTIRENARVATERLAQAEDRMTRVNPDWRELSPTTLERFRRPGGV